MVLEHVNARGAPPLWMRLNVPKRPTGPWWCRRRPSPIAAPRSLAGGGGLLTSGVPRTSDGSVPQSWPGLLPFWGRATPPPPLCAIPSGCCSFTGPWTVTRSSLRMLRRVAAFCRPLRPVLLLVSFPRSRSPVVGVLGLCWMWYGVLFARQRRPIVGVLRCAGCCRGRLTVFAVHTLLSTGRP